MTPQFLIYINLLHPLSIYTMEKTRYIGSCLSCTLNCQQPTQTLQGHKNPHIKISQNQFTEQTIKTIQSLQDKQVIQKINKFKQDLLKQFTIMLTEQNTEKYQKEYARYICTRCCGNEQCIDKMEKVSKGNYDDIKCCDIAAIQTIQVNLNTCDRQRQKDIFFSTLFYRLMNQVNELSMEIASRYGELYGRPPLFTKKKYMDPPFIPPPMNSFIPPPMNPVQNMVQTPRDYSRYDNTAPNIQMKNRRGDEKRQQKAENRRQNPRDIRNNNKNRRKPYNQQQKRENRPYENNHNKIQQQSVVNKDQNSQIFRLINEAKKNHDPFKIKVNIISIATLPDKRFRIKVQDQSGRCELITQKNQYIVNKRTIIVDNCVVIPYKGKNQIRADRNSKFSYAQQSIKKINRYNDYSDDEQKSVVSSNYSHINNRTQTIRGTNDNQRNNQIRDNNRKTRGNRGRGTRHKFGQQRMPRNTTYKKIKDIDPGEDGINLMAKVMQIINVNNEQNQIICVLGDQTGRVNACLPAQLDYIRENQTLVLFSISSDVRQEHIMLTTVDEQYETEGQQTVQKSVIIRTKNRINRVNLQLNISEKSWIPQ